MAETIISYGDLKEKGVLITGGGSGIGAALVEGFAAQGAKTAFIDFADEPSRELVRRLSATSLHTPIYLKADLRSIEETKAAVEQAACQMDGLSVLINNAGWDDRHDFATVTEDYWDMSQAINLKQVFFVSQAAAPHLIRAGGGSIVNFSSISYVRNMSEMPAYTTAKAAIIGLTKSLAGKLGPENIRVNALMPGMIVTERQKRLWLTEEKIDAMLDSQCLKQVLVAQDLVGPCLFLASSASAAITAQTLVVDGGVL
ncbi:SDR family oxidoreductase [Neorhizobium lilium]|uniref:SDR family oxidoreductase n=1 Tax=Neorhizobium lilium TaxID=2503024 RepID=A0A444LHK8_9HYPH|nr:SDR family oxidoreductase [Neorhizobium lilium]RWX78404.1 SDR family oxidoreductase [Neorhizobium lilium]